MPSPSPFPTLVCVAVGVVAGLGEESLGTGAAVDIVLGPGSSLVLLVSVELLVGSAVTSTVVRLESVVVDVPSLCEPSVPVEELTLLVEVAGSEMAV